MTRRGFFGLLGNLAVIAVVSATTKDAEAPKKVEPSMDSKATEWVACESTLTLAA